jgi:hypothetical protein
MSILFNISHKIQTSLMKKGYNILSKYSLIEFKISEVHRKSQLSGFWSSYIFPRSLLRFAARSPTVLTAAFVFFSHYSVARQLMACVCLATVYFAV